MSGVQPDRAEENRFEIALPNSPAAATLARRQLMAFIRHLRVDAPTTADLHTAVGEALANAAEHGGRLHGRLAVSAEVNGPDLEITISDNGPGFSPPMLRTVPDALAPRGYGLYLIQSVTDEFQFRDGGRTVWFRKRISNASEDAAG
jgi:anti-sigma regulatory factor (Ser/Thr protein kinase)